MEEEYKGYTIELIQDEDAESPRTAYDNLATMVCFHSRYTLGDKHNLSMDDFSGGDEVEEYIRKELKGYIILPLYLYDHSGITMSTTGFSCPWDSGQVGFIYITAEKIREEYSAKRISKKLKDRVTQYLVGEVEEYDKFLTGDVWGYKITDPNGNELEDSCWGFYGDKCCLEEAQGIVDWHKKDVWKKRLERIKIWIKNKVPLDKRIILA